MPKLTFSPLMFKTLRLSHFHKSTVVTLDSSQNKTTQDRSLQDKDDYLRTEAVLQDIRSNKSETQDLRVTEGAQPPILTQVAHFLYPC